MSCSKSEEVTVLHPYKKWYFCLAGSSALEILSPGIITDVLEPLLAVCFAGLLATDENVSY
jgi:hypothetical protein